MQWCGFARGVTQEACRCFNPERGTPCLYLSISEANQLRSHSALGIGSFSELQNSVDLSWQDPLRPEICPWIFFHKQDVQQQGYIIFFPTLVYLTSLSCYLFPHRCLSSPILNLPLSRCSTLVSGRLHTGTVVPAGSIYSHWMRSRCGLVPDCRSGENGVVQR